MFGRTAACLAILVAEFVALVPARAQEAAKTVGDGVYTDAQATRGAAAYDATCTQCHRADLGGAAGPALRDQRFARVFAGKDLKALFTKVATTMPRNAPASLTENMYLDIVAYMLRENGFPAGSRELAADGLDGIEVLPGRPKPPPPVGDYSYVDVIGCLESAPRNTWLLTHASTPVAVAAGASGQPPAVTENAPLGSDTFHLVDAIAYAPEQHRGHKIYVRGLLIKLPHEQRMTISSLEMLSTSCGS
jgi:cytochrome c5